MQTFSPSPCLFAEPEAVSKHSVSLWIVYSDIYNTDYDSHRYLHLPKASITENDMLKL